MNDSELARLKAIPIQRSKDPYRPVIRLADLNKLLEMNEGLHTTRSSKDLNAILLKFVFYTGLRISELVNLKLEHIFLDENKVLVLYGKHGKSRWVGINKELKQDLEKYIYEQRAKQ